MPSPGAPAVARGSLPASGRVDVRRLGMPVGAATRWLPAKIRERDQYRGFAASVVASEYMAETLLRNGFSGERIHVVPHFSRFEDAATAPLPAEKRPGVPGRDRPFELLFSGQAVSGKGLELLIAALRGIPTAWQLNVLADGPRLPHARALAETLGLGEQIAFLGWAQQAETREHYRLADILVIPSIWDDPAPLVGLEAMAFGTPLVGFAVGGIPDYLIDGVTGVLVRATTSNDLHAGLKRAMADPDRVHDWGAAARYLIARSHTRAVHESKLRSAYRAAMGLDGDAIDAQPAAFAYDRAATLDSVR
jgi:glycosyltransferase involved in cell wall biosynthesis